MANQETNVVEKEFDLQGKTVALTGWFSGFSWRDIKKRIIEKGGIPTSTVDTNTDFLLAGEDCGSRLKKAQRLGIEVITLNHLT